MVWKEAGGMGGRDDRQLNRTAQFLSLVRGSANATLPQLRERAYFPV